MGHSRASPLGRRRLVSQSPSPLSEEAEAFIRGARGTELGDQGGAGKFSTCSRAQFLLIRTSGQVRVWCAPSWLLTSWFYIILVSCLEASKSPGAGMPEGQSLYLLESVSRILVQTGCSSTNHTLVRVCTYRNSVERWCVGSNSSLSQDLQSGPRTENWTREQIKHRVRTDTLGICGWVLKAMMTAQRGKGSVLFYCGKTHKGVAL